MEGEGNVSNMNNQELKTQLQSKPYTWGKFVQTHEIGEYLIVEYKARVYKDTAPVNGEYEEKSSYHPYINGHDTSHSYCRLDECLVGVVAYKYEGGNSRAAGYFIRSIMENGELIPHKLFTK